MIRRRARAALGMALLCCPLAPALAETPARAEHFVERKLPTGIAPRYLLMNPRGRAVTQEDFRGRFQLITFGFVSCPDVCPTTLLELKHVLESLGARAVRLQPIFVSVDPERDTPEILRQYTAAFDNRILGLTGSADLLRRAADSFRVQYEKVSEPGAAPGNYTMNHTAGMYLLDGRGLFLTKFAYATPAAEIAARIGDAMTAAGMP